MRLVPDHDKREGSAKYEGYCVDLIEEIAQDLGFQYELYLTPDNQFGAQDDNGSWDGLVQQILVGVSEWNDSNLFC